jgi:L-threonylcarbamoyladenylate synthase
METILLPADIEEAIPRALELLKRGGLVAFPTDTVYGVGALAFDAVAVESIYSAKNRPVEKAIPILIGGPEDLEKVTVDIPPMAAKLAARFWPKKRCAADIAKRNIEDQTG